MPSSRLHKVAGALPWVLLTVALTVPLAIVLRGSGSGKLIAEADSALSDYGAVPDFELTERSGRALRRDDLAGSAWFANFVFTRCSATCPMLSKRMAELQGQLGEGVRLVSFSVDPRHDTPAVLSEYASRFGAKPGRWLFATGPVETIRSLVRDGFHLSAVEAGDGVITHSDRVALVDASFRIRRYYMGTEPGWVEEAVRDLAALEVR